MNEDIHNMRLNESIREIPIPERMLRLPISRRGYPVPWFVARVDGEWDFRVVGPGKLGNAILGNKCWLCGQQLGAFLVFVTGPMCVITRTSAEPPSHYECARYSARACPFLSRPKMRRNDKDMPEDAVDPAGLFVTRNPGVSALYVTRTFKPFKVRRTSLGNDLLIRMGDPERVEWYAEGRLATREEVQHSIDTGLPLLEEEARRDDAIDDLSVYVRRAERFLPPEPEGGHVDA